MDYYRRNAILARAEEDRERDYEMTRSYLRYLKRDPNEAERKPVDHFLDPRNPQHVALLKRAQDEQEREYQLDRSYLEHLGRDPDEAVMKPLSHFV